MATSPTENPEIEKIQELISNLKRLRGALDGATINGKQAELRALIQSGGGSIAAGNVGTGSGDFVGRDPNCSKPSKLEAPSAKGKGSPIWNSKPNCEK